MTTRRGAIKVAEFEAAEPFVIEQLGSFYSTEAYLTPTGPLVERHDVIVPNSFGDRDIATRHGLQRFEVENAINDGWLKR